MKIQYRLSAPLDFMKSEIYDWYPGIPAKWDTITLTWTGFVATYNWKYEDWVFIFEIDNK